MDLRERPATPFTRHPWETARARFFVDLLRSHQLFALPRTVLDVGAGDAFLAESLLGGLAPGSRVVCFDPHYTDEILARLRADAPAELSFTRERPVEPFDIVLLLDVLEHVPDDRGFLIECVQRLAARGGHVLLSVPAWQALFTRHDIMLGHYRRYHPEELAELSSDSGLTLVATGSLFQSLLVPRIANKLVELGKGVRARPAPDSVPSAAQTALGQWKRGPRLTRFVELVLAADNRLSGWLASSPIRLPGLSTWALGQRT